MVTPLPSNILVQDSNGTVVRARVQNPLVSDWNPKIVLPLVFPDPETIRANTVYAGTLFAGDGTAAAPSLSLESETTGFYRIGASDFGLSLAGTRAFSFKRTGTTTYLYGQSPFANLAFTDSGAMALSAAGTNQNITLAPSGTGSVRVGVGTGQKFENISGDFAIRANSGRLILETSAGVVQADGIGNFLLGTATNSSNGRLQLATHTTSAGGIGFGPNLWAHLTSAQELAVGTTTVAEVLCINSQGLKLSVSGSVSAPNIFKNGDANTGIWWGAADQLNLVTGGASALILDSSQHATFAGNVVAAGAIRAGSAATNIGAAANQVVYGGTTATTVGAAGGASALPATPRGYIIINVAGTAAKIPYYNI